MTPWKTFVDNLDKWSNLFANERIGGARMTRNSELLASFVAYCEKNPEQRFWQALRNWSGFAFVFVTNAPPVQYDGSWIWRKEEVRDTFYFEDKDK